MENKNIFNYRLIIFRRLGSEKAAPSATVSLSSTEVQKQNEAKNRIKMVEGSLTKRVRENLKKLQKELDPKDKKVLVNLMKASIDARTWFERNLKACKNGKEIAALKKKAVERYKALDSKYKEILKVHETRKKLLSSFDKHINVIKGEYKKKHEKMDRAKKLFVEWKHLNMLLDAFLLRWKRNNQEAVKKSSPSVILQLGLELDDKGMFKRGQIYDVLAAIKAEAKKVVDIWLTGDKEAWRIPYPDKEWDTKYKARIEKKTRLIAIKEYGMSAPYHLEEAREKAMLMDPPPLPADVEEGDLESPLTATDNAAVNWRSKLKENYVETQDKGKLEKYAHDLKKELNNISPKRVSFGNIEYNTKIKSTRIPILKGKEVAGYIDFSLTAGITLNIAKGKAEKITNLAKKPKEIVRKIEGKIFKPVVESADIDIPKKEVIVKGKNLPLKAVKIDVNKGYLTLSKPAIAGSPNVSLLSSLGKLNTDLKNLLKQAISEGVSEPPKGLKKMVIDKLPDTKLDALQKEVFEKTKPKIIIWGGASMEGTLARNKRLAKSRAESAKRVLAKKYPGVTIETRGRVYGPYMQKIENPGDLKKAEKDLVDKWNADVVPKNPDKAKRIPVKSAKEIYAKLKNPKAWEKDFIQTHFNNVRGSTMTVEYPKNQAPKIAMKFENPKSTSG